VVNADNNEKIANYTSVFPEWYDGKSKEKNGQKVRGVHALGQYPLYYVKQQAMMGGGAVLPPAMFHIPW
jgi:hypothetical protein